MRQPRKNPRSDQSKSRSRSEDLHQLIEQDAPLRSGGLLVLMYGLFQAEMPAGGHQGIASWLKERIQKDGLPSLVRFGNHSRAQVLRRDQLQSVLGSMQSEG
ncbi:hypothetical protein GS597_04880 [Synechococcales cyanobacterium C]|uniref:Uncharacterized protein n=1 Tax=Petrachloros mirabilis ULC683 TaxID=2781853 RepID=A0A8K2A682_9CYAN|nr:hypothetical protein [Petrachloros mirabilis]NCJ05854.1 hypothetical protein [Petrachloros mirabilis ULC683]